MPKTLLLSGNEAIARGAYEIGVLFSTGYPGTPSTEVLEEIADSYKEDIYCEWSPNEKVAFEVAAGASFSGARAMTAMKHVGLNVASDPLMVLSYIGVIGGFVAIVADTDESLFSRKVTPDSSNTFFRRCNRRCSIHPIGCLSANNNFSATFRKYDRIPVDNICIPFSLLILRLLKIQTICS